MSDYRDATGAGTYREVMGSEPPPRPTALGQVGYDRFVFGEVWSRGGITRKQRRLTTLACLAAVNGTHQLDDHVYGALRSGDLTVDELHEAVLHIAVYSGWPRAELVDDALVRVWPRIAEEDGAAGAPLPEPWMPDKPFDPGERDAVGVRVFDDVMTFPAPPASNPYTEVGVRGYVFGEMWDRPGLGRKDRRFITLACVCAADAAIPVESHVYAALNSGDVTLEEAFEVSLQCAVYVGWPKGSYFESVIRQQWTKITAAGGPLPPS